MAKVNVNELPTLDDFVESNLLTNKEDNNPDAGAADEDEDEDDKTPEEPKKPEAKKQDKNKKPEAAKPVKGKPAKPTATDPDLDADEEEEEEEETQDKNKKPEDNKTPEDDQGNFWTDVEKITGVAVEVDYGDVDPETPQGAAIREQALVEQTIEKYIETLQEKFPRAYKILEHEANGGKIEDLITPTYVDYAKIELKEDNVEQQKQILLEFYKDKGFKPEKAQRMVEADQDSEEGLFAAAKSALAEKVELQKTKEEEITKQAKLKQQAREQQDQQFLAGVKQIVDSGKLGQFSIVNKKDRQEFYNFITETVQHGPDENYVAVIPVDKANMLETLQQLYFGYKKGQLDEFITRSANTQTVRRLQRKISTAEKIGAAGEDKHTPDKQLPTFADFVAD